jgi:hypothetical protein
MLIGVIKQVLLSGTLKEDHLACSNWATQQTGFNPSQVSPTTVAQSSHQGGLVRGAARGSLLQRYYTAWTACMRGRGYTVQ